MSLLNKQDVGVYSVIVDPETGQEIQVPDPTARSIAYSSEDLEEWVKMGLIPKELGEFALEEMETTLNGIKEWKKLQKKGASKEELIEWMKEKHASDASFEKREKSIQLIDFLLNNKEKLLNLLSIVEEKTFRQSREIIDNKLTKEPEKNQPMQMTLFDALENKTPTQNSDNQINKEKAEPSIKGLSELTESEDKLLLVLSQLLSKKSERYDQQSPNYYMGNYERGLISVNEIDMETARIRISPHELYSTYLGRNNYNTDHIQFILNALSNLSKKNFLVTLNVPSKNSKKPNKKFDKLRTYLPLFQVGILNLDLTESESQEIDNNELLVEGKKCHLLFKFGPLFTNNIRDRYVEFPEDIHLRIAKAAGKRGRVSQCTNLLRDLLFREKQQGRYTIKRDEETLIHTLGLSNELKAGRRARIQERLSKAFKIFIDIGLLKSVEKVKGTKGQIQYIIEINKDFK